MEKDRKTPSDLYIRSPQPAVDRSLYTATTSFEALTAPQSLMRLQRLAGNRAVCDTLARRNGAALPSVQRTRGNKQGANTGRNNKSTNKGTSGGTTGSAAGGNVGSITNPWGTLAHAVTVNGNITEVDWTSFEVNAAQALEDELCRCPVQIASNGTTTAYHGNAHKKLPKPVVVPENRPLHEVPKDQQHLYTDYIEFTIAGGHKNKHNGIERGILDRQTGAIFITAHYDKGSIVLLKNAPNSIVADWRAKADAYQELWTG
jgi:hypothetical protein